MTVAVIALVLGVAGLVISLIGVATQVLPRQFTAGQQRADHRLGDRQPLAGDRRRDNLPRVGLLLPRPRRFPMTNGLKLTATRIGIARQASCAAATDAAVAAVLDRNGCEAMLRATYVDGTDSYVVTVGVAVMPGSAQAAAAKRELPGGLYGVLPVRFKGTPAAAFTRPRRQISGVLAGSTGTYVFFYTIGYADDRQQVPVTADSYADAEMTSMGQGVARQVDASARRPVAAAALPGDAGMLGGRGCRMVLAAGAASALAFLPCAAASPAAAAHTGPTGPPPRRLSRTPSGTARRRCSTCSTSSRRGRSPRAQA